jgi:hypothetical protein
MPQNLAIRKTVRQLEQTEKQQTDDQYHDERLDHRLARTGNRRRHAKAASVHATLLRKWTVPACVQAVRLSGTVAFHRGLA